MTFDHQDTGIKAFLKSLGVDSVQTRSGLVNYFVTYSGWLLLAFILGFYLLFPSAFATLDHVWFRVCVGGYFVYLIFLEIVSKTRPEFYETSRFRVIRIQVMMLFASGLVYVSGGENSPLWFIYLWPLFAVSLYFKQSDLFYAYIEVAVLYGLVALLQPSEITDTNLGLLLVNLAVMLVISVVFFYLIQTVKRYRKAEKRIQHFELFNDIRREIDSAVSLQQVLDLILQKAVSLVGVSDGSLMLLNDDGDLEFRAQIGRALSPDSKPPVFKEGEGVAGRVFKTGRSYICRDTKTDPYFVTSTSVMPIRSLLSVPIVSQTGTILGIINVDSSTPYRLTDSDVDLLSTLAMQVAQVVERAELWESLSRISAEALSDNIEGLYEHIVDVVHRLTRYPVLLWLVDESQESQAIVRAHRDMRDEYVLKRGEALRHSITGKVVDEGKEIAVSDISSDMAVSTATREEAALQGWKSLISIPLLPQAGKAVGVLTVFRTAGGQFTPWEFNLLKTFASQAGIAIRSAEQMRRERYMREQAETLAEVSRLISSNLKLEEVTKNILVQIKKVVDYRAASMQVLQGDDRVLLATEGFEITEPHNVLLRPASEDSIIHRVVEGQVPVILPDVTKDADWETFESTRGIKSWVGLPLVYREQTIGLLTLDHNETGFYTDKLRDTLVLFAQQAAIAVQNALLFAQVDKRNETLAQLLEVGRDISNLAIQEPKATLERIARELCGKLSADCVVIYPYDLTRETKYYYDINNTASFGLHYPLSLTDKARESGMARRVREAEGRILEIADISPFESTRPFIQRENIGAFSGIALDDNSEELGILYVNFRSKHAFTDKEREVIKESAAEIVMVLQSSWEVRQRTRAGSAQLPSLLKRIADSARGLLGADVVILYQYRRGRDIEFVTPPVICGELRSASSFMPRTIYENDIPALLVKAGYPYYADNIEDEPRLSQVIAAAHDDLPERPRFTVREGLKSSAGVLLKSEDEIVGVMFINYRTPTKFTQELRQEIDLFASQAAIAIRSARIVEQTQALIEVGRAISAAPDLPQLLDLVLEEALNLVGFSNGWISLFNPESNKLEVRASRGLRTEACLTLDVGEGITGHVAETGLLLRVPDVMIPQEGIQYVAFSENTRSELCVPLKYGDHTFGVLNLESPRVEAFTPRDEELMTALADIAATVIHSMKGRLQDIAALQAITEAIGEKTLDGVFTMVSEKAVELTGATYSTLWLLDEAAQVLRVGAVCGREMRAESLTLESESIYGHVALTREAYYSGDVKNDPHYTPWYDDINSNLCVPLVSGGRLLGALHVESVKFNAFAEYQRDLLQALGNQAAIAIEKAKGFVALQAINDAVTEKSLPEVLGLVVQQAVDVMPGEYGELWLFDPDSGELSLEAVVGPAAHKAKELGRIAIDVSDTRRRVAKTGMYEIHYDLNHERVGFLRIYDAARSSVTVPLVYRDEVVGTLNVESAQLGAFTEVHATLLDSFANQAAIAIVTARLVEQQLEDIALLQDVTEAITTQGLDEIWRLIAEKAVRRTQAEYCALWNVERDQLVFRAMDGNLQGEKRNFPSLPIDENSINGYVAMHGETYVCFDVENDPHYQAWLDDIKSSIYVPLKIGDQVIGTLGIESSRSHAFSEHLIKMLESLADQAAIAINSTRLYDGQKRKTASLRALTQIGQHLASGVQLNESEIVDLVYEQASTLLNTGDMYIALYSSQEDMVRFPLMRVDGKLVEVAPRIGGHGRTEWVIRNRRPILIKTMKESKAWYMEEGRVEYIGEPFASWIGVPMLVGEEVTGVIAAYHKDTEYLYDEDVLDELSLLANYAAVVLKTSQQLELLHGLAVDLSVGVFGESV